MAALRGFTRMLDPITEFDGDDEDDVETFQKLKYVRQLAMTDAVNVLRREKRRQIPF